MNKKLLLLSSLGLCLAASAFCQTDPSLQMLEGYHDADMQGIWQRLWYRATVHPINLLFLACFLLGILHTFAAHRFARRARQKGYHEEVGFRPGHLEYSEFPQKAQLSGETFFTNLLFFFGEVEVVFGLWCGLLFILAGYAYGWDAILTYTTAHDFSEAIYVAVALALASTYPIMHFADKLLSRLAALGGGSPLAWWVLLLTLGPLLGALIKESVAMTILALLLARHFYASRPSLPLAYATLGLLFTNISVSGLLTNFASSAVVMVSTAWEWDTPFMWNTFGWKAIAGIVVSNMIYFLMFHKELRKLQLPEESERIQTEVPLWVTMVHLAFLIGITFSSSYSVIVLGLFVLFLGFYQATAPYQVFMNLREPLMVGFFLASLILLSGLQTWWIEPIVEEASNQGLYLASLAITAFTHNASATLLFSHLPDLTLQAKYLLISACMAGGGLTIMANGPNLVAYSILSDFFNRDMSFTRLFLAALVPTIVMSFFFLVF